jgi:D-serine dehydratase
VTATVLGISVADWQRRYPLLTRLIEVRETTWANPALASTAAALPDVGLTVADIDGAADRLLRFAPYLAEVFPGTRSTRGVIESPLVAVPRMQQALSDRYGRPFPGRLWVKLDSELPISGSIKARGGIYEVLAHAEALALEAGILSTDDDYRMLLGDEARNMFAQHAVAVGSTGNLGLSIGIVSVALGFRVTVHMSSDARQWKKDRLRSDGVTVVEHDSDYSVAVAAGRRDAERDPTVHFVDDENSETLFLGYAVAARRLAGQLQALDVRVDADHPLVVHLPCGVGGGPGGVAFGLKTIFGDDVHCVFAEPTHSPCMFLGVYTGEHAAVSVQDFGIDNVTVADGLAVSRASGFVGRRMQRLLTGLYTVDDDELFRLVAMLHDTEGLDVEPSAAAGLPGALRLAADTLTAARPRLDDARLQRATHIAWATGGSMVPRAELDSYIAIGRSRLS